MWGVEGAVLESGGDTMLTSMLACGRSSSPVAEEFRYYLRVRMLVSPLGGAGA